MKKNPAACKDLHLLLHDVYVCAAREMIAQFTIISLVALYYFLVVVVAAAQTPPKHTHNNNNSQVIDERKVGPAAITSTRSL